MAESIPFQARSQFQSTPVYKVDNEIVYGLLVPSVTPDDAGVTVEISGITENRLDAVSSAVYGTPDYWWVIAESSGIIDVQFGIPSGSSVSMPTSAQLAKLKIL